MTVGIVFDEQNRNWSIAGGITDRVFSNGMNMLFLRSVERQANGIIAAKGFLTVNELFEMLGVEQTEKGALAGWVKDGRVDFGNIDGDGPYELTLSFNSNNVFRDK